MSVLVNKDSKVIVQGLGNVGFHSALYLQEEGAEIIGIAEWNGGIYDPKGIDVQELKTYLVENKTFEGYGKGKFIPKGNDLLEYECDILIPAALENQITKENANRIKAKIVGEAANGPVTKEASKTLLEKNIMLIPDMYLNEGGVTVSYFEWLKNLSHVRYGRMEKRFTENLNTHILGQIEELTSKKVNERERRLDKAPKRKWHETLICPTLYHKVEQEWL